MLFDEPSVSDDRSIADEGGPIRIQGQDMVLLDSVVARLRAEFPHMTPSQLRSIVTREWEAMTGGWPAVIPADVEFATRRMLRLGA